MKGLINILLSVWVQVVSPLPATINNEQDLISARQLLLNAYENNNHEAFVEAFPSSYIDYFRLFYYEEGYADFSFPLLECLNFFLFGSDYFDPKIIDKLVSVSIGFRYHEDVDFILTDYLRKFLNTYSQESALYLEKKEDAEIISFFRMTFQALYPENEWEYIMIVKKNLAKYSEKLIPLMKEAQKLALADNLKMVSEDNDPILVWW